MVDGANVAQLKEMLTICYPDPQGNINIAVQGQTDNFKRIMTLMGFEFMIMTEVDLEDVRKAVDPAGSGVVKIDDFARYLDDFVSATTNEEALTEAFKLFDADNDNRLSIEEFKFFMTGFAKEMNELQDKKIVENMLDIIYREKLATEEEPSFDIPEMVQRLKGIWAA